MDEAQAGHSYSHGYGEEPTYARARRSGDLGRRSGDRERYDADPQLLDDDFATLELRDSEGQASLSFESFYSVADYCNSSSPPAPTTSSQPKPLQAFFPITG